MGGGGGGGTHGKVTNGAPAVGLYEINAHMQREVASLFTAPVSTSDPKAVQPFYFAPNREILEHLLSKSLPKCPYATSATKVRRFTGGRAEVAAAFSEAFLNNVALVVQTAPSDVEPLMEEFGFRFLGRVLNILVTIDSVTHYMYVIAYTPNREEVSLYVTGAIVGLKPQVYGKLSGKILYFQFRTFLSCCS